MKKTCIICKSKIIEKKERWVRLTDFNKGEITGEQVYHLECWKDRFKISNSIRKQKMYAQVKDSVGSMLQAINPDAIKTFDIR